MVTTIQEVEVSLAFLHGTGDKEFEAYPRPDRLPGESPSTGFSNWQDAITPVADYSSTTNQNFIDWESDRLASEVTKEAEDEEIRTELSTYTFTRRNAIDGLKILGIIANSTGVLLEDIYTSFATELVGSDLEDPIKEFVTKFSEPSITNFGFGISDADKKEVLLLTRAFIHSGVTVWIGKYLIGLDLN